MICCNERSYALQLRTEERLDKLEVFTDSSNEIKSDEVSASVTVLVASTADVKGNETVLTLASFRSHFILSLQLSNEFLGIVDNIIRAEPEVLQESQNDANSSAKYEKKSSAYYGIFLLVNCTIQHYILFL